MSAPTAIHGGTAPLAALTSIFTPPCPTTWLLTTTKAPSQYPRFPTGPASCDPPSWSENIVDGIAGGAFNFYSPAICPQGFAVGPSCELARPRTNEGFPAVAPGETVAFCVPIGLTCTSDTTDFRGGIWGYVRETNGNRATVTVGPALQIRWVEADLSMLETHPLTPGLKLARSEAPVFDSFTTVISLGPSTTGGSLITDATTRGPARTLLPESSPQGTPMGSTNPSGGGSGGIGSLDRGSSIAIIVVVTLAVLVSVWATIYVFLRRRRAKQLMAASAPGDEAGRGHDPAPTKEKGSPESQATAKMGNVLPPPGISELDTGVAVPPMIGSTPNPAELEGDVVAAVDSDSPTRMNWIHYQRSWLRSPSVQGSPRSIRSTKSKRRTVRESFGEKVNDPAAVLSRLTIPGRFSAMSRGSPSSPSGGGGFWRIPRSPKSPMSPPVPSKTGPPGAPSTATTPKPSPLSAGEPMTATTDTVSPDQITPPPPSVKTPRPNGVGQTWKAGGSFRPSPKSSPKSGTAA